MKAKKNLTYLQLPPEVEALQFESLIETYIDLGLNRAQAAAAAQADYLCSNLLAFRRRGALDGSYFLVGRDLEAA